MSQADERRSATAVEKQLSSSSPDELAEQVRLQDAFLLAVAHDLRASVAAVAGASLTLREQVAAGGGTDALLDLIDDATGTIQLIISNLFDVERLRHGAMKVVRRSTELGALLRQCADDAGLGDRVEVEVEAESITVELDVGLTERVLWNLLRNAEMHAPSGTPIRVCASEDGGHVLIRVEDVGPGIPPDERESVFHPFQPGSTGRPGTGVGLFLVRQFTNAQGGETWIEGRPDGGTAVHVRLPC